MRISDWSSDVCSSDLRSSQLLKAHEAAASPKLAILLNELGEGRQAGEDEPHRPSPSMHDVLERIRHLLPLMAVHELDGVLCLVDVHEMHAPCSQLMADLLPSDILPHLPNGLVAEPFQQRQAELLE